MKEATSLHRPQPVAAPARNTNPTDYRPMKRMHLARLAGTNWKLFGELLSEDK